MFDASVSYLTSPWPIERIWRANQPDSDPAEEVNLDQDGISYPEIRRVNDDVTFRSLDAGVFAWRAALAKRQPLNEALDRASAAAPDFNLTLALQILFAEALAVDIVVSSTT